MIIYDDEYTVDGYVFRCGLLTTRSVLGICINLEDEQILSLLDEPEKLASCLKQIIPQLKFSEAHNTFYEMADDNGILRSGSYWRQWQEFIEEKSYISLTQMKEQAQMLLNHSEHCEDRAIANAKIFLECLEGNYPERYHREKTPEENEKASFDKKKPKLRLKLTIRDGYKCDGCGKTKEDSLCVVKKDTMNSSIELDNLVLRCRPCINKLKSKK